MEENFTPEFSSEDYDFISSEGEENIEEEELPDLMQDSILPLFGNCEPIEQYISWDNTAWLTKYRILTIRDRKDIARMMRMDGKNGTEQDELAFTLDRSIVSVENKSLGRGEKRKNIIMKMPESAVTAFSNGYRNARLFPITPNIEEGEQTYIENYKDIVANWESEEDDSYSFFQEIAPIPDMVWWNRRWFLVHFKILTLDERKTIRKILKVAPEDQRPHLEVQHTLAHCLYSVDLARIDDVLASVNGSPYIARMEWVNEFPENLGAVLASHYDAAKNEPAREVARLDKLQEEENPPK